jgi:hypothetical protein
MNFLKTLFLLLIILPHYVFAQDSELINKPDIDFRREYVVDCEEHGIFHFYLYNKQNKGQYKTNQLENDGFLEGEYYLYGFQYKGGKDPVKQIETPISKKSFKSKYKPSGYMFMFYRFLYGSFIPIKLVYNDDKVFILSHKKKHLNVTTYDLKEDRFVNRSLDVGTKFSLRQVEIDDGNLFIRILKEPKFLSSKSSEEVLVVDYVAEKIEFIPLASGVSNRKAKKHDYKIEVNKKEDLIAILDTYHDKNILKDKEVTNLLLFDYDGSMISRIALPEEELYDYSGINIISSEDGFFLAGDYKSTKSKIFKKDYDNGYVTAFYSRNGQEYFNRKDFNTFDFEGISKKNKRYEIFSKGVADMASINGEIFFSLEFYDTETRTTSSSMGSSGHRTYNTYTFYYDKTSVILSCDAKTGDVIFNREFPLNGTKSLVSYFKTTISYLKDEELPLFILERGGGSYLEFGVVKNGKYVDFESNLEKYDILDFKDFKRSGLPISRAHSVGGDVVVLEFLYGGVPINSHYHKL